MTDNEIERKIRSSSRIEAYVAVLSLAAAVLGYFFPNYRNVIGWGGFVVWGFFTVLYLFQFGIGRSWLGAFLPGCVAVLFFIWAVPG